MLVWVFVGCGCVRANLRPFEKRKTLSSRIFNLEGGSFVVPCRWFLIPFLWN